MNRLSLYVKFTNTGNPWVIRYMIGLHNKRTGITTLRAAPLHLLTHQVKALKGLKPAPVSAQQHMEARATLGETFGTKKAKANIRARERNKVDVSAMEGVAEHLQDRIEQSTGALPTQGECFIFTVLLLTYHYSPILSRGGERDG